jgi:hypothetical protein
MATGTEFSPVLRQKLLRFNGGLFEETDALDLTEEQLAILTWAAAADWRDVEPAIFGTLLERALSPIERHKLGAHYTPRAYVERLVLPTIIEPLREDWDAARAASLALATAGKRKEAVAEAVAFLDKLTNVRVLDPACGTGNFLYVAMARMKDLEGEVRDWLAQLGEAQMDIEGLGKTVDPHQFLGIEINPRAAAIADLVLWIGYLQWYFRTHRDTLPREPVLRAFNNIENRDAVLAYDGKELVTDEQGKPVSRWDGRSFQRHPVTGEDVPDESARVPVYRYVNARKAEWPAAQFVVGNPPFIGNKRMRLALGDGYAQAIRLAFPEVSETSDLVMYWWDKAAQAARNGQIRRFGLIATNSLTQTFNRKVIDRWLKDGVALRFAIPDHPWVDSANGAAVRISMSVGAQAGPGASSLALVHREFDADEDETEVELRYVAGPIHSDLSTGANITSVVPLAANDGVCFQGFVLVGKGFVLEEDDRAALGITEPARLPVLRVWKNGKDLLAGSSSRYVVDLFGFDKPRAQEEYAALYQHLLMTVKPLRDQAKRKNHRERWWIWGEARPGLRAATLGLRRMCVTNFAAKHRLFQFEDPRTAIDHNAYVIATDDPYVLGVLQSRVHVTWMLCAGSTLEDRPLWISSTCFDPFPFPAAADAQRQTIRDLAEQLDAHRKRQQAAHPGLTLTDMYNVLEKLRAGEELTAKDKAVHEQGLVSVHKQLHDDLDAAVFDAYGWPRDLADEQILQRLVDLNRERADEERRGIVRYLRPEFQNPQGGRPVQGDLGLAPADGDGRATPAKGKTGKTAKAAKIAWPKTLAEQAKGVRTVLGQSAGPMSAKEVAARFKAAKAATVMELLDTLVSLGQARKQGADKYAV